MTNQISSAEQHLREAEHTLGLCEDNRRTMNQQVASLRAQLRESQTSEQQERQRFNQPSRRGIEIYEQARADYDRAKAKFVLAESEFRKVEERFTRLEAVYRKDTQQSTQHLGAIEKKYKTLHERLEAEIERKEQEERTWTMKAENARRDTELWRKRVEELRRHEAEQLRKLAANDNRPPTVIRTGTRR